MANLAREGGDLDVQEEGSQSGTGSQGAGFFCLGGPPSNNPRIDSGPISPGGTSVSILGNCRGSIWIKLLWGREDLPVVEDRKPSLYTLRKKLILKSFIEYAGGIYQVLALPIEGD